MITWLPDLPLDKLFFWFCLIGFVVFSFIYRAEYQLGKIKPNEFKKGTAWFKFCGTLVVLAEFIVLPLTVFGLGLTLSLIFGWLIKKLLLTTLSNKTEYPD